MRYLSACSGIEAASQAFAPLGWKALAFAEIEPFSCAVLKHHYPKVPNLGDLTKWRSWPEELLVQADVLCGGPPCQSFSAAGSRNSMSDSRGQLSLCYVEFINAVDELRARAGLPPVWIMYENVPGLLSTQDNAFGSILGALCGNLAPLVVPGGKWSRAGVVAGPTRVTSWRIVDAQNFGLAQRRQRIYLLARGGPGNWDAAEALLPLSPRVQGDLAQGGEAGQGAPPPASGGAPGDGEFGRVAPTLREHVRNNSNPVTEASGLIVQSAYGGNRQSGAIDVAAACNAKGGSGRMDFESETFVVELAATAPRGRSALDSTDVRRDAVAGTLSARTKGGGGLGTDFDLAGGLQVVTGTLQANGKAAGSAAQQDAESDLLVPCHAFDAKQNCVIQYGDKTGPLDSQRHTIGIQQRLSVRRLAPEECEKLQGFPAGYTKIPWKKKHASECPDGNRYKAIGNSWAVLCARWVAQQIVRVEASR